LVEDEARARQAALRNIAAEKEYQALVQARGRIQVAAAAEDEARTRVAALRNIAAEKEYQVVLQQRGREAVAATAENEARTRRLYLMIAQAEAELQKTLQQSGQMRARADLDDEARTRRIGVMQISAEKELQAEIQKTALTRQAALNQLAAMSGRINVAMARSPGLLPGNASDIQAQISTEQARIAAPGGSPDPVRIKELQGSVGGLTQAVVLNRAETAAAQGVLESFYTRFGRYTQFIIGATIASAGFAAVFSTFRQVADTDRILKQIEATASDTANKFELLRASYDLIVEGNQKLGVSFRESGQTVFELQKALDGNVDQIRGAFLPALALVSLGEGNQKEIIRTLIGTYELFGDTLTRATTPMEKFTRIADILIAASVSSIADINGFQAALATVAPAAASAHVSLEETVSLLAVLQNGLQSAQRAGTGLSRLFRDIQENAPRIGKIFDVDVDINRPIEVLNILLAVAQKVRDSGALTEKMSRQIKEAFGDERAERALLTLAELLPKVNTMLENTANSAGRSDKVIKTLGETLYAALGRLGGALFDELNKGLAYLQGIESGEADGIVKFLDRITEGVRGLALMLRELKNLPSTVSAATRDITASTTGEAARVAAERGVAAARSGSNADRKAIFDAAAKLGMTFVPTEPLGPPSPILGPPSPVYGPPSPTMTDRKAELDAASRRIQQEAQTAVNRNNPYLTFEVRLALAQSESERLKKEMDYANKDFQEARFGRSGNQAEAEKTLLATSERYYRSKLDIIKIERDEQQAGIKLTEDEARAQQQALKMYDEINSAIRSSEKSLAGMKLSNALENSFLDADSSAKGFNDTVDKIRDSLGEGLKADTDKLYELIGKIWESPINADAALRFTESITRIIAERGAEVGKKFQGSVSRALLSESEQSLQQFRELLAKASVGGLPEDLQKAADKAIGVDKLTDAIRVQQAVLGKWGADAAVAGALAAKGFTSIEDAASKLSPAELEVFLDALRRLSSATTAKGLADVATQIDTQSRALEAARGSYGLAGEEADRYTIALNANLGAYDKLAPAEQAQIDRLARITAERRNAAAASGLVRLGFDPDTAEVLAGRATGIAQTQQQANAGIEAIRTINEEQRRARELQEQFVQESAKASGSFLAYFTSALRQAAVEAGDFWDSLKTLAEDTAKSMSQSLSDFFFDSFQNSLTAGKDAWKSFLTSLERALADFMSKQLVRTFLNILTGGGEAGGAAGAGVTGLLGGVASGFGSIGSNFTGAGGGFAGVGAALFGLPATPTTVQAGLQPSNPDLEFAGLAPTQIQTVRQATSGLIGTGGQVSRDLAMAGVIAAAYTASQSVLKLTSEISTQRDRNSGIGGIAGTVVGGVAGSFFGAGGAALGAGAGGILGSFLGGLFGSNESPAGRFEELSRSISTVQTALEASVNSAKTFTDLYNVLLGFQGGGALAAANNQAVGISAGGQPISSLSQGDFLTALRANPSSLLASVQAGVSPELLGPLNQEVVQTILAKVAALDNINQQITRTIAEISALSIAPATGIASLDTLKEQAINFRATVDQLVSANTAQISSLEDLLRVTTDPAQILQYTTEIKALIEDRYKTETQLVQQFAGQLDSLASSLKAIGKSIEEQIFQLELSNFGPTNPLQGFQLAQGRFDTARATFEANPTAENAQAVQAAVDPLLKAASEVFTRPSPEYRAIFAEVIDALETVKSSVDNQAADIQGALQAALGTSISIQDLTQRNTAAMADDMRQLLAIVQAQAAAAGIGMNAGVGFLNPQTNPPPSGQVAAPTEPASTDTGSQTGAILAAVGTIGALAGPLITIADKLGATDYLKNLFAGLFTSPSLGTSGQTVMGGGSSITNPDILSGVYSYQAPSLLPNFGASYSPYYSYTPTYTPYDYGYMAEGGPVPGSGMGDTVRAMLEPGEFVVRRDVAARNREWLEQINGPGSGVSRRGILHFQDGGVVPGTASNTVASAEDIALLLYLQSITGASSADTQALIAELLRQAEAASQNPTTTQPTSTSPATPSTVSGGATTATPSVVATEADATAEMLRTIQTLLRGGQTVTGLFSSGDLAQVLGPAGSALGIASGALGLFGGIASDDPFGAAAGGVQLAASTISLLAQTGVISSIPYLGGYAQAVLAAIQIAQIATSDLSDEEKAIQATKAATTAVAVALAGPTFGASLAVLQIWDFVERMRAGQPFDQAIVSANDPTTLLNMVGGERDLSISGLIFNPSQDWMEFVPKLYENAGTQGEGFQMLLNALPYVKSKEELGQLLNTQKNWVSSITGIPLSVFGGADSPYSIQTIPGIGPETHGQETTPVDWAETSAAFQQLIDIYKSMLPGTEITGGYGTAEGSLSGEAVGRLWNQFRFGDPGWFNYGVGFGAEAFNVLNGDSQYVNTEHNEAGANYVLNPYWRPWGTAMVYDGVDANGMNKFVPWGPGWQAELGIRFDPRTGAQVYVAPGGQIPPTIESMYSISPEWQVMQALYGLPPVVPISTPGGGAPQPTGYAPPTTEEIDQANLLAAAATWGFTGDTAAIEYRMWLDQMSSSSVGGLMAGGWVPGVSRGTDSIPMWLEPGEFVVPRAIAKANSELLMSLLGDGGGTWDMDRTDFGQSVSSMARELVGGAWDGLHRADAGSTISAAARSGDYRGSGGVSSVALHIAEGAIRIDGARDPKVVSRDVLEAIEQNIRTGRLGQVIASRVRPQRTGV
jgi:hypothetical protein